MTTPNGLPAWVGNSDYSTYGGHANKVNYQSQGLINGRTDVGAEAFMRLCEDLAAVMRGSPFCTLTWLCNDSSPAAPTVQYVGQMTGFRATTYEGDSAPTGFPALARNGDGDVTVTWASSYTDAYGVSGSVNITQADACAVNTSSGLIAVPEITSGTIVRVRAFTSSTGAAIADATVKLTVWTGP